MNVQPKNSHHRSSAVSQLSEDKRFYSEARVIVKDLFRPSAKLYWIDLTMSVLFAYVFASIYLALPMTNVIAWICFPVAAISIYRAAIFIHEIVHLPNGTMNAFKLYWNIVAGIPMLVPSFTYDSHLHHHSSRHYGTVQDGEYLPLGHGSMFGILLFMMQVLFQPILVFLRYLIGTPISFLHPKLRQWFYTHATSLVINFKYEKEVAADTFKRSNTNFELACSFLVWSMIVLIVVGIIPEVYLLKILLLAVVVLTMNHVRTLVAHRYRSDGGTISHLDQFLDSTNITGSWWTEFLCPCGLRYHALHHLFPGIPYHNLGIAHRRLIAQLPPQSPYHETVYSGFTPVLRELLQNVRQNPGLLGHHHH